MTGKRPLKLGMAGGGEGAFIGAIHRHAAALDGDWQLVTGAFSSDADRNGRSGAALNLDPARVYGDIHALIAGEQALPADERIDALAIVTPNHLHAPMAIAALNAGIHVFCEKPMAMNGDEARAIAAAARGSGAKFALAFTYSGYPLVEEARARIARGELGKVRVVQVEYLQGWLSLPIDGEGNKQAEWRTDPARAGLGGCLGDIGTHAFHLAEHVAGVSVETLSADLTAHVPGRRLDDDVSALLRFEGGARGTLKASQVAAGEENGLKLRVSGERGTLEWAQMEPNTLTLRWLDRPTEVVRAGGPGLGASTQALLRTPSGHPEGYIEAFANLYQGFAAQIRGNDTRFVPGLTDGLRTMAFIEAMIANAASDAKWTHVSGEVR
ncbi:MULTISPECIES: Gfo/Idh/MocA family protein [unclassified Sphingomonas]|uniref:Gfo/Idh/MocA family protein n=1 Tax=unclassified Sphingomonas TaxID=196159 RepID=UPI0006F513D7|nr:MULTISPECIES: Gfo/Idh/MocA family oxidoreductase [unclassified Sphingomonas]KQM57197.1 oxidoreductase [Sphingomonas sp. Leaf16]KQN10372.1 oxidoreductase [Sphingomonas sp. Leaf29]KQN18172.1 oxidoreductase [Sphingomonas sp. Leaf32]